MVAAKAMVRGTMPTITARDMRFSLMEAWGGTSSLAARKLIRVAEPTAVATAPIPMAATVVTVDTVLVVTVDTIVFLSSIRLADAHEVAWVSISLLGSACQDYLTIILLIFGPIWQNSLEAPGFWCSARPVI
jgi:hypothetical protein